MQAVGDLDEDHACVVPDGEEELADVLSLQAIYILGYLLGGDLGKSLDDLSDLVPEAPTYILYRILCILHDVMQECTADGGRAKTHLLADDTGYGYRV